MKQSIYLIVNLDKLTCAGNLESLGENILADPRHMHVKGDMADAVSVRRLLTKMGQLVSFTFRRSRTSMHSALGQRSPLAFEQLHAVQSTAG